MAPPRGLQASAQLVKWWKNYEPVHGMITRTISPYRQDLLTPWVKKWPEKIKHKIEDNWTNVPTFIFGIFVVKWANAEYDKEVRKHRD